MRMPRVRPPILLLTWVLWSICPTAAELAFGTSTQGRPKADQGAQNRLQHGQAARCDGPLAETVPDTFLADQLCPLEKRLFADAADGRLDEFSPLQAALVASGVEDAQVLQRYRGRQADLLGELGRSGKLTGPPRQRARALFEFMHRRVLTAGYRSDCTDLRTAFDQGRFNCVSASVLFNCLAGELGLAVCGLEIPGHAMSRLMLPNGPLDVETTCPRWFQLIDDPGAQAELVTKALGPAASADRSLAREISYPQMAAMIYYNRGVDLLAQKRFDQAATANAKALRLDPQSVTARGNLLATINNWAIALGGTDQYAEAVDLLREGLRLDPAYETFVPNFVHVHHQWVEHLCQAGKYEEALQVLDRAAAEMPDRGRFQQDALEVYQRWARKLLGRGTPVGSSAVWAVPEPRRGAGQSAVGSRQ